MLSSFASNPFFGLALTFACWALGLKIQKKTGLLLLNPVLVAAVLIVVVLTVFGISFKQYNVGGSLVSLMLGPATAVLALNIYQQREILHKNFLSVVIGCTVGCLVSIGAAILLCRLFGTNQVFSISMLPKSVTTAIALGISESGGGIPGITAAAVVFTGIEGAVIVPWLAKLFRITHPVAEGVAIGACSHAIGTSKALEIGKVQGAMSSISLCVCGILTTGLMLFFG
ncbi:LrgB family protein [Acidaminococcus sp. NSJ-142]|jgi:predicted murein hydrolase (TIGR00659 family)|uniref:LrgB family protein n=1 Tax=Acidaminococcus TaxID=904 RepID=UPI000CFA6ED0|nr:MULTISPECIES: LrgB family protein [Acidaminococcus]MCD2435946.1 LrgB family protein [Acidaminococcus hominis]RHK02549.1 LrgB family protein [Acidaminococcus sp. AM05-11]